jgi:hypothetical protein
MVLPFVQILAIVSGLAEYDFKHFTHCPCNFKPRT